MGRFELQVLYARAMTKLWEKIEQLKPFDGMRIADFGTRRRHSFLWQDWCVQAMCEGMESIAEAADEKPKKKTSKDTANVDEEELEEFEV